MSSQTGLKEKLLSAFKKAAFGAALATTLSSDTSCTPPPAAPPARLTAGEVALVQSIFGAAVNTAIVTKNFYPPSSDYYNPDAPKEKIAAVNDKRNIIFYGPDCLSDDYSKGGVIVYGTFVHEMTHIWQRQAIPGLRLLFMSCHTYDYALDSRSRFSDFCIEQQGVIIEDYALRFLHPSHASLRIKNTPENDALLKKVVEEQFPAARETRLALEEQERLKTAAANPKSPKA